MARKQLPLRPAGSDTVNELLGWYDAQRRDLPWRYPPGERADPYRVWLSEIMLQQTTVKAVIPFFEAFVAKWPNVADLASADRDDVLAAWAGLGYYSRARNLHACAQVIANDYDGQFPSCETELLKLPGVGPYTAAAIAAIAFGKSATPVDGNIERVVSRLFAFTTPLPGGKSDLKRLATSLTPASRAGDFAQAMMDLGATICTPKRPSCLMCPIHSDCHAHAKGIAANLPMKAPKGARPNRFGSAFVALREDGAILLRKRPDAGLLGGMMEVPSSPWIDALIDEPTALSATPVRADWWAVPDLVVHVFTHFRLEMRVFRAVVPLDAELTFWAEPDRCVWVPRRDLSGSALPSVMKKIVQAGLTDT
ncbi:MAG: A/G-specific adenine glycosylase [Pseudomonadota bacterium]